MKFRNNGRMSFERNPNIISKRYSNLISKFPINITERKSKRASSLAKYDDQLFSHPASPQSSFNLIHLPVSKENYYKSQLRSSLAQYKIFSDLKYSNLKQRNISLLARYKLAQVTNKKIKNLLIKKSKISIRNFFDNNLQNTKKKHFPITKNEHSQRISSIFDSLSRIDAKNDNKIEQKRILDIKGLKNFDKNEKLPFIDKKQWARKRHKRNIR